MLLICNVYRGIRVIAIDTGSEKEQLVKKLGAEKWIDFKSEKDIVKAVQAATPDGLGPHAAVVAAAGAAAYEQALEYLRPHGVCVAVGLPPDTDIRVPVFWTVFLSKRVVGSYVGNRQDAHEALALAAAGKVKTLYKTLPLADLPKVYGKLLPISSLLGVPVIDFMLTAFFLWPFCRRHARRKAHRPHCPRHEQVNDEHLCNLAWKNPLQLVALLYRGLSGQRSRHHDNACFQLTAHVLSIIVSRIVNIVIGRNNIWRQCHYHPSLRLKAVSPHQP